MNDTLTKRDYTNVPDFVRHLYFGMHSEQTVDMARMLHARVFETKSEHVYSLREMFELGKTLHDTSDPDALFPQSIHWIQTALRALEAGASSAEITGAISHDMEKVGLHTFYGITGPFNWGDTFPLGCQHDVDAIETIDAAPGAFALNPDSTNPLYSTKYGMYEPQCGLDNLLVSFGHDEAIYQWAVRNVDSFRQELPQAVLDFFRWHSCYAIHTGTAKKKVGYEHLLADGDLERMAEVKRLSEFDLYSKETVIDPEKLYSRIGEIWEHVDVFVDPDAKLR